MVACAAADTSAAGSTEDRAIGMRGFLVSCENAAYRVIQQRYPDVKRSPVNRAVTFDGAHKSQSRFRYVFPWSPHDVVRHYAC